MRAPSVRGLPPGVTVHRVRLEGVDEPYLQRPQPLPVQDLSVYEALGGHTLRRHVFTKPGDELRRIREEGVAAAGRFLSQAAAQRSVAQAISMRRTDVLAWLRGRDRHAPFTFLADMGRIVGHTLTWEDVRNGVRTPRATTAVRVVLRRSAQLPGGFLVLTAYPTRVRRRVTNGSFGRGE